MFSKDDSEKLRKEFWTSFGKSFPRKWLLYNTKIKGVAFKFQADRKKACVCLDFENPDEAANLLYFDQLLSLKNLLIENHLPEIIFDDEYLLDNGKVIQRIYVPFEEKFSIHNKNTWQQCYEFFVASMTEFEAFYCEYETVIKDI
ncbi:DUF4268 domain-containing protein [Polaribacter sp.]|nr:DUF4268 domain-containing protein [Polaribacter sp.]MDA9093247.1 DUF4268 domain-containing protein [Polaribacter sp.]MDB4009699.1 DUF4268 domain-containing protein [Polaribacter sp.]MDB4181599.1 DUF4268 domain-containing protein [Polaribacter sp.]